ncbi:MAG TPA: fused MFS/spermidine synthase [Steroidobacteraceae bacterium]|nr:fused MFS/spermidine synthase [Steroidobacteraceae bacterium]
MFGTSELAVVAVLAAYMGGLALGAFLIERWIRRIARPVLWYAALELGIGVTALLVPLLLELAGTALVAMFGNQPAPPAAVLGGATLFYLAAAFVVLLLPTTLMGATLPLLVRHAVRVEADIGRRIGTLYACNTAGAVLGALSGALLLLPALGLRGTVWAAAALNLVVAGVALRLATRPVEAAGPGIGGIAAAADSPDAAVAVADPSGTPRPIANGCWVLPLMLLSGAVSFVHEVVWSRMLGHVLGSSLYAFGVMLASFLAGIALGGALGAKLARERVASARWLALAQLAVAAAAMLAWLAIVHLPLEMTSFAARVGWGFGLLFPLAIAIGLTYPLAVRVLTPSADAAARCSARVYAWNTVGAIAGTLAAGLFILPALRYEGAVRLAVTASAVLAVLCCLLLFRPRPRVALPVGMLAVGIALLFAPRPPDALLRYSPLRISREGELLYYGVGRSAAVVALGQDGQIMVRTGGLPEAAVDRIGRAPQPYVEAWMTPLAVLARPALADLLVVGLGGGRVLEAVPPSVKHVDVIELEPEVVAANRAFAAQRAVDPLQDPRLNLVFGDARGALALTGRRYDAIVSQPSHPWTAGASHLYTREFMQQARAHLRPGGVLVQWMNVEFVDADLLRSLLATLDAVFRHVRVYRPAPLTLLFLASDAPAAPELDLDATRAALAAAPGHYARLGLNVPEDLAAALALDDAGSRAFAAGAPAITDDRNLFATRSVYDRQRSLTAAQAGRLFAPYDPLSTLDGSLAVDYIARRLIAAAPLDASARERVAALAERHADTGLQVYLKSLIVQSVGQRAQALEVQQIGTTLYPQDGLLRDAVLESGMALPTTARPVARSARGAVDTMPGTAADTVLAAEAYAAASDWPALARLDAALARIPWTSLWSDRAQRLRAEWVARRADPPDARVAAARNLALIDREAVVDPTAELYLLRARSSMLGQRPADALESAASYADLLLQSGGATEDATRDGHHADLAWLRAMVDGLAPGHGITAARLAEVRLRLRRAQALP